MAENRTSAFNQTCQNLRRTGASTRTAVMNLFITFIAVIYGLLLLNKGSAVPSQPRTMHGMGPPRNTYSVGLPPHMRNNCPFAPPTTATSNVVCEAEAPNTRTSRMLDMFERPWGSASRPEDDVIFEPRLKTWFKEDPSRLEGYIAEAYWEPVECTWTNVFKHALRNSMRQGRRATVCAQVTFPSTFREKRMDATVLEELVTVMTNQADSAERLEAEPFRGNIPASRPEWSTRHLLVENGGLVHTIVLFPKTNVETKGGRQFGYLIRSKAVSLLSISQMDMRMPADAVSARAAQCTRAALQVPGPATFILHPALLYAWAASEFERLYAEDDDESDERGFFQDLRVGFLRLLDMPREELVEQVRQNLHQGETRQYYEGRLMIHLVRPDLAGPYPTDPYDLERYTPLSSDDKGLNWINVAYRRAFRKSSRLRQHSLSHSAADPESDVAVRRQRLDVAKAILRLTARSHFEELIHGYIDFENAWLGPELQQKARHLVVATGSDFHVYDTWITTLQQFSTPDRTMDFMPRYDAEAAAHAARNAMVTEVSRKLKTLFSLWIIHEAKRRSEACLEDIVAQHPNYDADLTRLPRWLDEDVSHFEEGVKHIDVLMNKYHSKPSEPLEGPQVGLPVKRNIHGLLIPTNNPRSLPAPDFLYQSDIYDIRAPTQEPFWTEEWWEEFFRAQHLHESLADGDELRVDAYERQYRESLSDILITDPFVKKMKENEYPARFLVKKST